MSRITQSQWEFGEIPEKESRRKVLTVTELTGRVKRTLEQTFGTNWVTGEVTNCRRQSSRHVYFTLKDDGAQLQCVLFRGTRVIDRTLVDDGQRLVVQGELTVYEPRGQYQMIVREVEALGIGELQAAFERLKKKLAEEGVFAPDRKRPLPSYPQRIGVITSPTGAALRDVLHVVGRRYPGLRILIAPCRVQGEGAAEGIAEAIVDLNRWAVQIGPAQAPELILLTRGGGSLEDLWAFNEEVVARAIAASALPVVSAVGHEIDFTISDFAADVRAATPSAAAEILTEGVFSSRQMIADASRWMSEAIRRRLLSWQETAGQFAARLARAHPKRRIDEHYQRLDDLNSEQVRCARFGWKNSEVVWRTLRQRWIGAQPARRVALHRERIEGLSADLRRQAREALDEWHRRVTQSETRLRLLSPQNVLDRGYSITLEATTQRILRDAAELTPGERLVTRLASGTIESTVSDVSAKE